MIAPTFERWVQLWRQVTDTADPLVPHQELVALYSQPHRHYHTLRHVAECLAEFDSAHQFARQPAAVELAIWFHDAIYEARTQDNEARSAELAKRRIAGAGGSTDLCQSVAALILATKAHDPSLHPDAPLLVDVDLSILGHPSARFWEYEEQIRREYDWVPQPTFAEKRAEILQQFLARERIYTTEPLFAKYERRARANLGESLRKLKPEHAS